MLRAIEEELSKYLFVDAPAESLREKFLKEENTRRWNEVKFEKFRAEIGVKVGLLNAFTLNHIR